VVEKDNCGKGGRELCWKDNKSGQNCGRKVTVVEREKEKKGKRTRKGEDQVGLQHVKRRQEKVFGKGRSASR
jgi:hypothetical protein